MFSCSQNELQSTEEEVLSTRSSQQETEASLSSSQDIAVASRSNLPELAIWLFKLVISTHFQKDYIPNCHLSNVLHDKWWEIKINFTMIEWTKIFEFYGIKFNPKLVFLLILERERSFFCDATPSAPVDEAED